MPAPSASPFPASSPLALRTAPLLCIDIGNTHTHAGLWRDGALHELADIPTAALDADESPLRARLASLVASAPEAALAFCSVVPAATPRLRALASGAGIEAWQLTHEVALGVPISYPKPSEIGQDRLANAAGANALAPGRPAVVIDLGTAVTFDLVTPEGGYEGGIITPGPALVTRYLHERTAQLPLVTDLAAPVTSVIGKSTAEAIRIGATVGYAGLIQTLLDAVLAEYAARRLPSAEIFLSGGAAQVVQGRLRLPARVVPDLALLGLVAAHALNHPPG